MAQILIADDDAQIRLVLRFALEDAGFQVTEAATGAAALRETGNSTPDLIIMDVGMPNMDGFEATRAIRAKSQIPVLFLTARDEEVDRVRGFELGADDYVTKPFSPRELVLRVRAILARSKPAQPRAELRHGALRLVPDRHEGWIGEAVLALTATEFKTLQAFVQAPARIFTRDQLIEAIYGRNPLMSDRTIDSHVRNLRKKARDLGCRDLIETVHGVGLRLGTCQA